MSTQGEIPQLAMIRRVRELCNFDKRFVSALMYGSFSQGEGDAYSDIEFWFFVNDVALPALDQAAWLIRVHPLEAYFSNEFGSGVAIFDNLVRGEFHFVATSEMRQVRDWPVGDEALDLDAMIVLDRTGELLRELEHLQQKGSERLSKQNLQTICNHFLNWFLLGINVLRRGERARALDALANVHRQLLWMARAANAKTGQHFLTPSRRLEDDLGAAVYQRYVTTTASVTSPELEQAYAASWNWGRELITVLAEHYGVGARQALLDKLELSIAPEV